MFRTPPPAVDVKTLRVLYTCLAHREPLALGNRKNERKKVNKLRAYSILASSPRPHCGATVYRAMVVTRIAYDSRLLLDRGVRCRFFLCTFYFYFFYSIKRRRCRLDPAPRVCSYNNNIISYSCHSSTRLRNAVMRCQ